MISARLFFIHNYLEISIWKKMMPADIPEDAVFCLPHRSELSS